ncbi:MAG: PAS domain S-box protein [Legionellales bacterium]|nr:PAS domain S-box protein [Legionellales bacterium]
MVIEHHHSSADDYIIEKRFITMANSAPVMLWMSDVNSECYFFNDVWLSFTGKTLEQEIGVGWTEGVHPEDLQNMIDVYLTAFNRREPFRMEYRLRSKNGHYHWLLDQGTPYFDQENKFCGYIGSCVDISDIKQYEQQQQTLINRLLNTNAELENFAHIVSHDLQEPVRNIVGLLDLLTRKIENNLDDDAKELVRMIDFSGKKMKQLIEGLLSYCRIKNESLTLSPVDMSEVITTVLVNLHSSITENTATITYGEPWPLVMGNKIQIIQLLQNLISNAIKYRSDLAPKIHLDWQAKENFWQFNVSDNGIGFDNRFSEKIFDIFKRLHTDKKYTGSGIGLSICKKVVEIHGGTISAKAIPNQGAIFTFTLPAA